MTTSTLSTDLTSAIVADLGGNNSTVDMMIGIGLNKESDAVFFQYMGSETAPVALMLPSGKPCTRMQNVLVTGITIADEVGEFNSTKLNVFITTGSGHSIMLTSGLTTLWSQYLITGLMGAFASYDLTNPITIDTWKGTSKMRPCFAAVRVGREQVKDEQLKQALIDLKADGDTKKMMTVLRDAVDVLNKAVAVEEVAVTTPEF